MCIRDRTEPMPEESKPEQDEMSENAIAWPVVDFAALESINSAVSYTHLDVYKRQLLSRRRYRSMMAVSKDTPLSRGTWSVTSPEVVVRFLS